MAMKPATMAEGDVSAKGRSGAVVTSVMVGGVPCCRLAGLDGPRVSWFKPKLNTVVDCNTAMSAKSRTVVLPSEVVYNRRVFYAILASDPLCRITVTVKSPQFSRLECP